MKLYEFLRYLDIFKQQFGDSVDVEFLTISQTGLMEEYKLIKVHDGYNIKDGIDTGLVCEIRLERDYG